MSESISEEDIKLITDKPELLLLGLLNGLYTIDAIKGYINDQNKVDDE